MFEPIEDDDNDGDTVEVQAENNDDTGGVSEGYSTDTADTGGVPEPVPSVDTEPDVEESADSDQEEIEADSDQEEIEADSGQEEIEADSGTSTAVKAGSSFGALIVFLWMMAGIDTGTDSSESIGLL